MGSRLTWYNPPYNKYFALLYSMIPSRLSNKYNIVDKFRGTHFGLLWPVSCRSKSQFHIQYSLTFFEKKNIFLCSFILIVLFSMCEKCENVVLVDSTAPLCAFGQCMKLFIRGVQQVYQFPDIGKTGEYILRIFYLRLIAGIFLLAWMINTSFCPFLMNKI